MGFLAVFSAARISRRIDTLAAAVADQCRDRVYLRLSAHVATMGHAEARGYVRARAAAVVRREVGAVLWAEPALPEWAHRRLLAAATERVVHRVADDLLFGRRPRSAKAA